MPLYSEDVTGEGGGDGHEAFNLGRDEERDGQEGNLWMSEEEWEEAEDFVSLERAARTPRQLKGFAG